MIKTLWNTVLRGQGEEGQALVEYGLIMSLVSLVAIVSLTAVAGEVDSLYGLVQRLVAAIAAAIAGG